MQPILVISDMYSVIKLMHIIISATFLVIAIWTFIRAIRGMVLRKTFKKSDKNLAYAFIIALYLQFIFGLLLFSNLLSSLGYKYMSADHSMKIVSKRLWPVEHIVLMIFAVVIANLGLIIALKSRDDKAKFRNLLFYFLVSLFVIFFSLFRIYFL